MKSFEISKEAKNDLRQIARYTEKQWGREQRYLYIKQFDDIFHCLAENPKLGKQCDDIKAGYRKYPQGTHLVFYREIKKFKIMIIRILHNQYHLSGFLHLHRRVRKSVIIGNCWVMEKAFIGLI